MRNTHTDTLAPWDRPCWTDGIVPLHYQFGLTAHEARIGRWCFDGDGDNGDDGTTSDPSQAPDFTGLEDVQGDVSAAEAAAAAAAEAESAANPDMGFDQDSIDAATAFAADAAYDVDYNAFADLAGIGKYDDLNNPQADIFDQQIAKQDAAIADAIQADAQVKGYDVNVGVDPDGTYSYTAGPDGTFGDVAAVAGSQVAQGLMDLSPTVQVAQALGLSTPDFSLSPREGSAMMATAVSDPYATGYQAAYDRNMAMTDAPVSAIETSSVPTTLSELKANTNATPEYDPFSPGPINDAFQVAGVSIPVGSPEDTYQAAYDLSLIHI